MYTSLIFQVINSNADSDNDIIATSPTWAYVKDAFERTLENYESEDYSILSYAMLLPTQGTLTELSEVGSVDPLAIHEARGNVKQALAREFQLKLKKRYDALTDSMSDEFSVDSKSIGLRRLRNVCLQYLCSIKGTDDEVTIAAQLAKNHYDKATCMTDKVSALTCLSSMKGGVDGAATDAREDIIARFYNEANGDSLVLNKWFQIQAGADLPDIIDRVKSLKDHPSFTVKNPNRCRALIGAFTANPTAFHAKNGDGYTFIRETLEEVDPINASISSRLSSSLITWKKYDYETRGKLMKDELEQLSKLQPISDDLFEIVTRGLK